MDQAGAVFDQSILIRLGPGRRRFRSIHPHRTLASSTSFSINPSSSDFGHVGIVFDQSILIRLGPGWRRFRSTQLFHQDWTACLDKAGVIFDQSIPSIWLRPGRRHFRSIHPFHHKTQKVINGSLLVISHKLQNIINVTALTIRPRKHDLCFLLGPCGFQKLPLPPPLSVPLPILLFPMPLSLSLPQPLSLPVLSRFLSPSMDVLADSPVYILILAHGVTIAAVTVCSGKLPM